MDHVAKRYTSVSAINFIRTGYLRIISSYFKVATSQDERHCLNKTFII